MDFALKQVFVLTIILGTILVIISENRNPVKTIAWCVVLAFMPVIGLLLYILFGMDNRHRRLMEKPCVRDPRSPSAVDPRKQV